MRVRHCLAVVVGAVGAMFGGVAVEDATAQANSWTNDNFGKWETNSNWSLGVAPTNTHSVFITNALSKTVTIDAITAGTTTMTVSNLTVAAPLGSANTLLLNNSGLATPLRILHGLNISDNATFIVFSNSVVQLPNVPSSSSSTMTVDGGGFVNLTGGGTLVATNGLSILGNTGTAEMTVNGTLRTRNLSVAVAAGSIGTLRLESGLAEMQADWTVGIATNSMGSVWMTGGQLAASAFTTIGFSGSGRMIVSNGTVSARHIFVGSQAGGRGTLTVAGGVITSGVTNNVNSALTAGNAVSSTGFVWIAAGQLIATNTPLGGNPSVVIGRDGVGQLTLSNGTVNADTLAVGLNAGSAGTLTVEGGTLTANRLVVTNNAARVVFTAGTMTLRGAEVNNGDLFPVGGAGRTAVLNLVGGTNNFHGEFQAGPPANSTGIVWMTGGELVATNDLTSVGYSGTGLMTVSNGTFRGSAVRVGNLAGSRGTLTLAGGTNIISSSLSVSFAAGVTGTVWLTGGELVATNAGLGVGINGIGRMTVSNGTCRALGLFVGDSPGSGGTLTLAGGTNVVGGDTYLGINTASTGAVWIIGGELTATNGFTYIGSGGVGRLAISNGTWRANEVVLAQAPGSQGTLTVAGGTVTIERLLATNSASLVEFPAGTMTLRGAEVGTGQGFFTIGGSGQTATLNLVAGTNRFGDLFIVALETNSTGVVLINGGDLVTTNNGISIAARGRGTVIVSNGTWRAGAILVGEGAGSDGLVQIAGGSVVASDLSLGDDSPTATGTVTITSGQLFVTNGNTRVGKLAIGRMTVSGGIWRALGVIVGDNTGGQGTLTIAGGTSSVYSNLTIGNSDCTATGAVTVTGGSLFVTNSAGDATLEVRSGTLRLNSGTLRVDTLILTNSCAKFVRSGGTLLYGTAVLNPANDTDGDGFSNQDELNADSDPLDSSSIPAGQVTTSPVGHWEITISGGDKGQGFVTFNNDFTASGYGIRMNAFGLHELTDEWAFNEKGQVTGSFIEQLGGSTNWTGELLGKAKSLKSFSGGITTNGATKTTFKWKGVPATDFPDLSGTWANAQFSFILTENADHAGVFDVADADAPGVVIGQLMVTTRNKISGYATLLGKQTTFQGKFTAKKSTLTLKGSNEDGEKFNATLTKADE